MLRYKIDLTKVYKKLEGGEDMISAKHALEDYDKIVADTKLSDIQKVLGVGRIIVKILLNIRTNQTGGVKAEAEEEQKEPPKKS